MLQSTAKGATHGDVRCEVGTKLVFENERAKVWGFTLNAPDESIGAHAGGDTHGAQNVGATRCYKVLVELKGAA